MTHLNFAKNLSAHFRLEIRMMKKAKATGQL